MKSKLYVITGVLLCLLNGYNSFSQANTSLSNLASTTAINHTLTAGTTNSLSLGSTSKTWKSIYLSNGIYINSALVFATPHNTNIAIGSKALYNTTSYANIGIGIGALYSSTSADHLVAIGDSALYNNTSGLRNTAVGTQALYKNTTGDDNTAEGYQALYVNSTGENNIAAGFQALYNNTLGNNNVANGTKAMYLNTSGYSNVAFGIKALYSNKTGNQSIAIGDSALYNSTGSGNVAIGSKALYSNTSGTFNTAVGYKANVNGSSATNATAIGSNAYANCSSCIVLGGVNGTNGATTTTFVGIGTTSPSYQLEVQSAYTAIYANSTGSGYGIWGSSNNLGVFGTGDNYGVYGSSSSYGVYGTSDNIGVYGSGTNGVYGYSSNNNGVYANSGYVGVNTTGTSYGINTVGTSSGSYGVYASGGYVSVYATTASGTASVGNSTDGNGGNFHSVNGYGLVAGTDRSDKNWAGVFNGNTYAYGAYQTSDRNLKKNIKDVGDAMSIINQLKPKTYEFLQEGKYAVMHLPSGQQYGLIAQDLETVLPGLVKEVNYISPVTGKMADTSKSANYKTNVIDTTTKEKITTKAVNYIELIPIIIKALQETNTAKDAAIAEQNIKINNLQNQIDQLKAMITSSASGQQSAILSSASLQQNIPNPFTSSTSINYNLPQAYSSAQIIITDKKGVVLKQVNLSAKGKGNINVDASTLSAGAYQYSLYVNNRLIDTKQMLLTK